MSENARYSCSLYPTRVSILTEIMTSFAVWGRRPIGVKLSPRGWAKLSFDVWPNVDDEKALIWLATVKCEIDIDVPDNQIHIYSAADDKHVVSGWSY